MSAVPDRIEVVKLSYLVAVASLFVFCSYGVQYGDDVRGTVGKISCACDWRLMDIHGIGILKNRETGKNIKTENRL